MLNDSFRREAFANQLVLHHFAVGDDAMRHAKRHALDPLLPRRAKAFGFAFRSYPRGNAREEGARHPEHIRVEAVRVHDVDVVLFQESREAAKLFCEIQIVEARQPIFRNFTDAQSFRIRAQRTFVLQTRNADIASATLVELSQQLQSLTLAATLLETVDDEKDVGLHFRLYCFQLT